MKPPIVLLTDFGHKDHYVGVIKGVIHSIAPQAAVIDLCHEVPPQDIRSGAYLLGISYRFFPKGTIFLSVVDPGVGTDRRIVIARLGEWYFFNPLPLFPDCPVPPRQSWGVSLSAFRGKPLLSFHFFLPFRR